MNDILKTKLIFKELFTYYLVLVGIFFAGRSLLFINYYERISDAGVNHWYGFLLGLQMDTIVASIILVVPALLLFTMPKILEKPVRTFLRLYFLVFILLAIYIENATFPFIAEFDVRPNEIFINYLEYPREVLGNIWASYKPELAIAFVMLVIAGRLYWKTSRESFSSAFEVRWYYRLALLLPVLLVLFIGIRSSFGHRPANISLAVYTGSHLVNEITKNSLYAIGYAYYSQKKHGGDVNAYGKMAIEEAYERVSKQLNIPLEDLQQPFSRTHHTHNRLERPKNLVILIEESLGAQFVGALGGEKGITPNLDRLSEEGVFFRRLYSNGTRSIRGIAGCVSGCLPVPGEGVVKRNKSQNGFFTVASLLKPYGYHSSFIYGGESNFDNMRSWFLGNGFDEIIDEPEFDDTAYHGIWGVSDDVMVERALKEFKKHSQNGKPFVSVLFSTTNHTPFEYPAGKIEPIAGEPVNGVKNAIKFADYAIGKLIDGAKQENYYENTVFVIVADHNVRVYGDDLVPVNMFHIPALIMGGGIEPMKVDKLSSQPDVIATALDLIGVDLTYPILGNCVFGEEKREIALMQFHDMYALRNGNKVAVIQPNTPPLTFMVTEDDHLKKTKSDTELEKDALAFVLVNNDLYQRKCYN